MAAILILYYSLFLLFFFYNWFLINYGLLFSATESYFGIFLRHWLHVAAYSDLNWRFRLKWKSFISYSIKKKVKKGSSSGSKTLPTGNSPSRHVESPAMSRRLPVDPSEAIGTAIVKYNYQAQQADELSLSKGTRILILEKSNDGYVYLTNKLTACRTNCEE